MKKVLSMRTNKEKLGDLGEAFAARILDIVLSENKYDMEKDGTIGTTRIEVKTQNRHPFGYFTVNTAFQNQLPKCLKVDRLVFVEYDNTDKIKLWECVDRKYTTILTKSGRKMAGWPIDRMELIHTEVNPALATEMRKLSGAKQFTNA